MAIEVTATGCSTKYNDDDGEDDDTDNHDDDNHDDDDTDNHDHDHHNHDDEDTDNHDHDHDNHDHDHHILEKRGKFKWQVLTRELLIPDVHFQIYCKKTVYWKQAISLIRGIEIHLKKMLARVFIRCYVTLKNPNLSKINILLKIREEVVFNFPVKDNDLAYFLQYAKQFNLITKIHYGDSISFIPNFTECLYTSPYATGSQWIVILCPC